MYYGWSKEFLEAGKRRLAGDTARAATSDEVKDLRREAQALKEVVADLTHRRPQQGRRQPPSAEANIIYKPRRVSTTFQSCQRLAIGTVLIWTPVVIWRMSDSERSRKKKKNGLAALIGEARVWG
jgi:hypothetical protein